jgi:hypothetical protein
MMLASGTGGRRKPRRVAAALWLLCQVLLWSAVPIADAQRDHGRVVAARGPSDSSPAQTTVIASSDRCALCDFINAGGAEPVGTLSNGAPVIEAFRYAIETRALPHRPPQGVAPARAPPAA